MAEDQNSSRVSVSFSGSFHSLHEAEDGPDRVYYHENSSGGITPILSCRGNYYQIVEKPVDKSSYLAMRDQSYKEAKTKVCQVLAIGGAFFCLARMRNRPQIQSLLKNYLSKTPVFWGLTLPPALAFDPTRFNPYEKYRQARSIEQFLSEKEEKLPVAADSYLKSFQEGLGLSYPLKTELDSQTKE